jgi:hypothetical protein
MLLPLGEGWFGVGGLTRAKPGNCTSLVCDYLIQFQFQCPYSFLIALGVRTIQFLLPDFVAPGLGTTSLTSDKHQTF